MIPRLNNLCNIYHVEKDFRGEFTLNLCDDNRKCRFSITSENVNTAEGQINRFILKGHINSGLEVKKGQVVEFECKTFKIILAETTKALSGKDFFQYLEGEEFYATN